MTPAIFLILALVGHTVSGGDVEDLAAASSSFSQSLYQEIAPQEDNVVYSPFSIHACLSMCSVGARGDTATEMAQALGTTTVRAPHQAYHDLIEQMNSVKEVKLNTANAIYVNPNMPIEDTFISEVQTEYFASSSNFDLAAPGGPEAPINAFVNNKTEGLIKDIIPPGSIDASTVMVLINTIFFNGTWAKQFETYKTRQQDFQQLGGTKSQVDMMHDDRYVNIKRGVHGADVAELPFKGGRFSLYIALPQKVDALGDLESVLATPGNVDDLFTDLQGVRVQLAIPKFKIESTFDLNGALQNLGINKAFQSGVADFSGMIQAGDASISSVVHKAMIEVKETGTVAAAATAIMVSLTSIELPPSEQFIADHPFLFFLRDNVSGDILFEGKFSG